MARAWCMCAGCNRVLFQDTALWKSDKPYCEECAPKGAKRPEPPEPVEEFEPVTTTTDDVKGFEPWAEDGVDDSYTGG